MNLSLVFVKLQKSPQAIIEIPHLTLKKVWRKYQRIRLGECCQTFIAWRQTKIACTINKCPRNFGIMLRYCSVMNTFEPTHFSNILYCIENRLVRPFFGLNFIIYMRGVNLHLFLISNVCSFLSMVFFSKTVEGPPEGWQNGLLGIKWFSRKNGPDTKLNQLVK